MAHRPRSHRASSSPPSTPPSYTTSTSTSRPRTISTTSATSTGSSSLPPLEKSTSHDSACTVTPFSKPKRVATEPARSSRTKLKPPRSSSSSQANRHNKSSDKSQNSSTIHPTLLQPRLAVVLNVPSPWHPWLFVSRLLSILPAVWWGLPSALHLLLRLLPGQNVVLLRGGDVEAVRGLYESLMGGGLDDVKASFAMTEAGLATIWCFASGYLSFFFTDCLMSRWLINYTPQATIVRLLTVNAINAYTTSIFLSMTGGFEDPRLLLPGWVVVATTLTMCYHISHQKINIRKETSTSINVFSIASYISMLVLLIHMLMFQPNYPTMPIVSKAREVGGYVKRFVDRVQEKVEEAGR